MTTATQLEDLKPSRTIDRIDGIAPSECVTPLTLKGFGTDAIKTTYKRTTGNPGSFFPARGSSQMEARKPSRQGVNARTADTKLKRAKPRRVRLRCLAAQAACGILVAITTLLALPAAAQAQTKVPSDWSLIPAGLGPGDSFRLIFGSSTERNGTTTDIPTYNTWIQNVAASGHTAIRAYSSGFRVVGSTAAVDARDNTGTTYTSSDKGVPIY